MPACRRMAFQLWVRSMSRAVEHIAGYILMCDWSARDDLLRNLGLGLGHPMPGSTTAKGCSCRALPDQVRPRAQHDCESCRQEVRHSNCSCHLQDSCG
ncbi:hypothetical protein FHR33_005282 [Nonomuraea dietziae]|uniref:Uncharacterized protein n=1 Tax=Nonomuraea dietziae TaxID=65515 RepID=A0A7W5VK85_9ACTN|nr:hypothetical protein [Nonomuraea dietziae]